MLSKSSGKRVPLCKMVDMDTRTRNQPLTEDDFVANEARRLRELAGLIRVCGRTPLQIARDCNLDKRTVQRAMRGEPLKSDAQARIEFYIKNTLQNGV